MAIEFVSNEIVVDNTSKNEIEITLTKTTITADPATVNVIFSGADCLYPSAQQYNGVKVQVRWGVGENGEKKVRVPIEPTANRREYLLVTLDDVLGDEVGSISRAYIMLSNVSDLATGMPESFLPSEYGRYVSVYEVDEEGVSFGYIPQSQLAIAPFTPSTETTNGISGAVPAPVAGDKTQFLSNQGWADLPVFQGSTQTQQGKPGIIPAPAAGDELLFTSRGWQTSPVGGIDTRLDGLENADTLIRGQLTGIDTRLDAIEEVEIPGIKSEITDLKKPFTPSNGLQSGGSGLVPAPPFSSNPLLLTNQGWASSPIPSIDQRLNGIETIRIPLLDERINAVSDTLSNVDDRLESVEEVEIPGIKSEITDLKKPFTPNTPTMPGTVGLVPAPPASDQVFYLTDDGWNTIEDFTPSSPTMPGEAGLVPPPPTGEKVLTSQGWRDIFTSQTPGANPDIKTVVNIEYLQRLLAELEQKIEPIGTTKFWLKNVLPGDNWMWCRGQELSRTQYPELFAEIGTFFGAGDGVSTFNLPPTLDRVFLGAGGSFALGQSGGEMNHQLTETEMPLHGHVTNPHGHDLIDPTHTHYLPGSVYDADADEGSNGDGSAYRPTGNYTNPALTGITIIPSNVVVNPTGGNQPHNNMQPFLAVNFVIKVR